MRRTAIAWIAFVTAAGAVACGSSDADDAAQTPGQGATATRAALPVPTPTAIALCNVAFEFCTDPGSMESARVVKIIDGDTLDVTIDGREERVRVFGIDTTERGQRCFSDASQRLEELAGDDVRLVPDVRERDRNGRLLRYVYTEYGVSIDALLIDEGLAYAWKQDGALRDDLIALETRARAAARGCLWRP